VRAWKKYTNQPDFRYNDTAKTQKVKKYFVEYLLISGFRSPSAVYFNPLLNENL